MFPILVRPKSVRIASLSLSFALIAGCQKQASSTPESNSYVENNVVWAYGAVQLTGLDAPGQVMVKRQAPVQTVDNNGVPTQAGAAFSLYGSVTAVTGAGGSRDLAYVDYHPDPNNNRMLAYAYGVEGTPRNDVQGAVDLWAKLKKPGRSFGNRYLVYLGYAVFPKDAVFASLTFADGLNLSQIADGVFAGQWALHYPPAPAFVSRPWQGLCPKIVAQIPGQNPNQNPSQFAGCRPIPAQSDLCYGDPTKDGCRPKPPIQMPIAVVPGTTPQPTPPTAQPLPPRTGEVTGLEVISEADRVYALAADQKSAKISFVSTKIPAADDATNAQLCAARFLAVGRTEGRQVNTACLLSPAPATAVNGLLTCAITITFDQAQTYLEKVCNVTGLFRNAAAAGQSESETLQVLKR